VVEFARLGYLEQAQAFLKRLDLKKIDTVIENSFCSELMKAAYKKLVHKRAEEINDELSERS
jgi:hypothetical protein